MMLFLRDSPTLLERGQGQLRPPFFTKNNGSGDVNKEVGKFLRGYLVSSQMWIVLAKKRFVLNSNGLDDVSYHFYGWFLFKHPAIGAFVHHSILTISTILCVMTGKFSYSLKAKKNALPWRVAQKMCGKGVSPSSLTLRTEVPHSPITQTHQWPFPQSTIIVPIRPGLPTPAVWGLQSQIANFLEI